MVEFIFFYWTTIVMNYARDTTFDTTLCHNLQHGEL